MNFRYNISIKSSILIYAFGFIFFGCSKDENKEIMNHDNTIVVSWAKGVLTLDPACADGFESAEVVSQIYEGLVTFDTATKKIKPNLATSWKSSSGGLVWDFTLRQNVRFHDGSLMDAQSVVFSFERQMNAVKRASEGNPIPGACRFNYWHAYFDMIKSVKALDSNHVRFKLKYRYSPFLNSLEIFSSYIIKPFNQEEANTRNMNPIGTGPFKYVSKNFERTVLEKFPKYWKTANIPKFRYLIFQTISDNSQRFLALQGGSVDIAHHVDPNKALILKLHPFLNIKKIRSVNISYIALNTAKEPFSIRQNRIAINHAIDRIKINKLVYQGTAEICNAPFPPFLTMNGKSVYKKNSSLGTWYDHNLTKAKNLFKEGGVLGGKIKKPLNLYLIRSPRGTMPYPLLMANLIKNDLKKIGVKVIIHAIPYNDYKTAVRLGKHEMALHAWIGDMWDPDNFLYGLLHSNMGTNYSFFSNSDYDKYVKKGRTSIKLNDRIVAYRNALKIFKYEAPWVPLTFSKLIIGYSQRIHHIEHTSSVTSKSELMTIGDE